LRLSPARPRQAPVRKWVIGSNRFDEFYFAGLRSTTRDAERDSAKLIGRGNRSEDAK
jgi:hypothetical protein